MRFDLVAVLLLSASSNVQSYAILKSQTRSAAQPYAPYSVSCPSTSLIRQAQHLNRKERSYIYRREEKASRALRSWLASIWGCEIALPWSSPGCPFQQPRNMPILAMALSGGGPKAGLAAAGVLYSLDARENSSSSIAGLLQSISYISALSGGSLTLSGVMANDFAKISTLKTEFYDRSYQNTFAAAQQHTDVVAADTGNKTAAGYVTSLLDKFGIITGYNFVGAPPDGGNGLLWSQITSQSSFQSFAAPYPIITITNADVEAGKCEPETGSAIWEISPDEFGSWDDTVHAFFPTEYMGTPGDRVMSTTTCTAGFDNVGFVTATSSNILVNSTYCSTGNYTNADLSLVDQALNIAFPGNLSLLNPYAIIPNPFHQSAAASASIRTAKNIYGTDGGDSGQGIPLIPFLQPARSFIDVVVIIDAGTTNSSTPYGNSTNGEWLFNTYIFAQRKNLMRMPPVPSPSVFAQSGLGSGAHFYGCYDKDVTTLVYIPDGNAEESQITNTQYFLQPEQIDAAFNGGIVMATQAQSNASSSWPACLACGIMHKSVARLPRSCDACLKKYCWRP